MPRVFSTSRTGIALFVVIVAGAWAQYPQQPSFPAPAYPAQTSPASQAQYPQGTYPQSGYPQGSQQYPPYAGTQNQQPQADAAEDQAEDMRRGVARVSIVEGDVNVKRGDAGGEIVAAVMNAPLTTQDRLQTGQGARAEVQFDYGNIVRVGPGTDLGMSDLEYHRYRLQLAAGTMIYRVLRNADAQAEIDTPSIAARPAREGEYRISVFDDGTTQITVRSGELEISGPRGSERIGAGRTVLVRGDPSDPEFQPTYELARDQLDSWSEDRDRQLLASQSYRYVSPDIEGAEDLDRYGTWVPSEYGTVWAPRTVDAGWAPYSNGHWVWEPYYGWSWVDYAPWGWAPYHYGRWFWNGGHGWCWWAGPVYGRHLWRPALVGFFGIGGVGVSVGLGGFGGLGWVALAPFEAFHPWWGRGFYGGRGYYGGYRNVSIINVYHNARIHGGAITSVYGGFGGAHQRFGRASVAQLRSASLVHGRVPVTPTRASYEFGRGFGSANSRFAAAERRNFYQPQRSSQAGRAEFGQAQMRAQQNARFGFSGSRSAGGAGAQNRAETNGAYVSRFGQSSRGTQQGTRQGTQQGWQRFGAPGPANGFMEEAPRNAGGGERSGWHQFGAPAPQPSGGTVQHQPFSSGGSDRFSGYSGRSSSSTSNGSYRAPSYHYSAPQRQEYRSGGMSSGGYSHPSSESSHAGSGGSYRSSGGAYHGGGSSSHGGGGSGHHGR
jgi:hypothetical protein